MHTGILTGDLAENNLVFFFSLRLNPSFFEKEIENNEIKYIMWTRTKAKAEGWDQAMEIPAYILKICEMQLKRFNLQYYIGGGCVFCIGFRHFG